MTPDQLADRLEAAAARVGPAVERHVEHAATLGAARIRANASGRPGPNVITGAYRASWRTTSRSIPHGATCTIGTHAPQGRRLEFGFYGPDSLGRVYAQPPFAHVGPAIPAIEAALHAGMGDAVREVLS